MKITHEFYEVRSIDDIHGIAIRSNESAEKALEEINRSYEYAKKRGFDNKDDKWIIVCNQIVKVFDEKSAFLKEERTRFVVAHAEYSIYENAFVFAY